MRVATGDAGLGVPENAPYDRAIITIGSLDVPPAWACLAASAPVMAACRLASWSD